MKTQNTENQSKHGSLVKTIERAALILDILGKGSQGFSIKKLSKETGLPKGSLHRLLSSLAYFDYVRQDSNTKNYHLGFKLVELGNHLINQIDLRTEAHPYLIELSERTKETVHMAILDHGEAIWVDKVDSSQPADGSRMVCMVSVIGARIPTHCTAVGKVLLAFLSEERLVSIVKEKGLPRRTENTITDIEELKKHLQLIREQGYALNDEEDEKGVKCLAAPIRDQRREVIAAISISVPSARTRTDTLLAIFKDQVVETAMKISQKLGYF